MLTSELPPKPLAKDLLAKNLDALSERIVQLEQSLDQQVQLSRKQALEIRFLSRKLRLYSLLTRPVRWLLEPMLSRLLVPQLFTLNQHVPEPLNVPSRYGQTPPPDPAPMISIVTPSFNQAEFLPRTMDSVLSQDYPQLQYMVQDGGSKDGSREIIRSREGQLCHWESGPDGGQADAINRGFEHATGEIMAFLNSDDLLLPGTLNYVARVFAKRPDIDVIYGHRYIIDEQDRKIGTWVLPPFDDALLPWVDYIPQETMFWRRRAWDRAGGQMDDSFQFALDWDLLLRMRAAGAKFYRAPRFLGAFRVTLHHKTATLLETDGNREMARLRQRYLGRVPDHREVCWHARRYQLLNLWLRALCRMKLLRY